LRSSNTSPERAQAHCRPVLWLWTALAISCLVQTAEALDPNEAMSRYIHDEWNAEQGYPGGAVYAITQANGYLWIGTAKGLVRFDGFNFRLIQDATSTMALPIGPVLGLVGDPSGNLWVRPRSPSLLYYRDGAFKNLLPGLMQPETGVTAMCRGKDGTMLLSSLANGMLRYRQGKFEQLAPRAMVSNFLAISLAETPDGKVWIGTRDSGLFMLHDGQLSPVAPELRNTKINCILPLNDRELWIGTDTGAVLWDGARIVHTNAALDHIQVLAMIQDRASNIWVGTSRGLARLRYRGGTWGQSELRPGEAVLALFEDREGNLWTGSERGMERVRDSAFVTYGPADGLPSDNNGPVYVDDRDRTWFAPVTGGLYWLDHGNIGSVTEAGLGKDVVYTIAGRKDELWVGRQRGGLTHLVANGDSFSSVTYTQAQGLAQNSVYSVYQARDGTVWAGTLSGGVSKFSNGRFKTYTLDTGLASNTVSSILEASDGTMWFATPNGLSALWNGRWQSYAIRDGMPSENVNCLLEDSTGVLWIGTAQGLAFLNLGHIQIASGAPGLLQEQILGIAEDQNNCLWIATSNRVLRVNRDKLLRGALEDGDTREYGLADGLRGVEGVKRHRSVVADAFGHVWFSMNRGVSVVDPTRVASTAAPAIVGIQNITADGNLIPLQGAIRIPSGQQRITFGYAGLSLSVPGRVRFKYTLDGFDRGWSEPLATREANYTNLGPGSYRFRVIASNPDGVWNSSEARIGFEIDPAFWQTWWFRVCVIFACALGIAGFYRLRLRGLTRQLNVRFEERLAERTRIAQELHDTLLQGFLSASMQLHVAVDRLPPDSPAKSPLGRVLELMGQVIEEGRNAVRGLRSSQSESLDLEQAFARIQQELAIQQDVGFRVIVDGQPRPLHPVLRDEVYRIGREALVNAFRHSRAKNIEIELEYAFTQLRVLVRDNGCGIDPQMLQSGREGHWGLPGMRERAERIGAKLHVWSRPTAGTEVELSVPSHIAFRSQSAPSSGWLSRLAFFRSRPVPQSDASPAASKNGKDQ
jgi:ligand-binding sensor domain-containing protein/signal transduction histidine kinase